MAASESVIRKCVHCGFCTATCPTYVLLGDELDSPRGRIYLMKDMLERQAKPTAEVVKHVDRCLSCLSCMTTCPSDVHYMHLVDHARAYIAEHYRRPLADRAFRRLLAFTLPSPARFRTALWLAWMARPLRPMLQKMFGDTPLAAMLALAPAAPPQPRAKTVNSPATANRRGRVLLLQGCAEPVLQPNFRAATVRLLNRAGYDVVFAGGEKCCGALVHHMGYEQQSMLAARTNIDAWMTEISGDGIDAILVTASGCGTTVCDYGFMLRNDPSYAANAARVSALARDITAFLDEVGLPPVVAEVAEFKVAYHAACSLQHGQKVTAAPMRLLTKAGFAVSQPLEAHLCCGSAGTYNILQPQIASQLGARKAAHLDALKPAVIATGNIGCAMQIGSRSDTPIVHTVELLDWATGGPKPAAIE